MSKELIAALRSAPRTYHPGWRQREFDGWMEEQMSWKETCYIGDWSFLWNLEVEGPEALKLFSDISVNSFRRFHVGQAKHVIQCSRKGKVIAEGVLMRLSPSKFWVQSTSAFYSSFMLEKGNYDAESHEAKCFNYQVQGPNALALLEKLSGESLREIEFMHFRTIKISDNDVIIMRMGMAGEVGFELQGSMDNAEEVYKAVTEIGKEFDLKQLGRRTVMINHLEACFPTGRWHYLNDYYNEDLQGFTDHIEKKFGIISIIPALRGSYEGEDISDYFRSPVELGWTKNIKFDHEFIGRKALEAEMTNPIRTIVTLEFNSEDMIDIYASLFENDQEPYQFMDIPHQEKWVTWADKVVNKEGKIVGISTVPGHSYYYRKILSLAYVEIPYSKPGTELSIVWGDPGTRQTDVRTIVAPAPYKPDRRRTDLLEI